MQMGEFGSVRSICRVCGFSSDEMMACRFLFFCNGYLDVWGT